RDLEKVWVFSPTKSHREAFAAQMNDRLDASIAAVSSVAAAIEDSDIIITATTASTPVFDGELLEPGMHITAMGQYDPNKREVD
ncbi:MAG: ornithine cyclodeaminase family protein, partial [Halobacteriaceae archaeon]